jgi:hypothetical protein
MIDAPEPEMPAPEMLALDDTCPRCGDRADVGEILDGSAAWCMQCGQHVVAVAWTDLAGNVGMSLQVIADGPAKRDGRRRTRALWRKRGRR